MRHSKRSVLRSQADSDLAPVQKPLGFVSARTIKGRSPKRRQRFFAVREMHVFGESVPMSCLSSLLSWGYHADERLLAVHIWLFLQEQIKDIIILFSSFWRFL